MIKKLALPFILTSTIFTSSTQANSFRVEGSDLLMGIGPAEIARAGASSASTNDIFATRWNPAGLADIKQHSFSISQQLDSQLTDINFTGFAFHQPNILQSGYAASIAFTWLSRLHIKSKGMFDEDGLESVFLEYALAGYPRDFNGKIESKTREYSLAWGIKPTKNNNWGLGMIIGYIQCGTSSCGVRASNPNNYHVSSTDATAISVGIGVKYQLTDKIKIATRIKDINTKLKVETKVTSDDTIEENSFTTHLPLDLTLGAAIHITNRLVASSDLQIISGKYGSSSMNFQILRLGIRKTAQHFTLNAGSIIPIRLYTESTGDFIRWAPIPLLPTLGVSWQKKYLTIDFAAYPNAIASFLDDKISFSSDVSISISF